jgi:hypothetical protein
MDKSRKSPSPSPIAEAYAAGLKMRANQKNECGPMRESLYKLREYYSDITETSKALSEIGKYARLGSTPYALAHCMGYEKSKWAKGRPKAAAYSLGKNFVGVLHGLTGDGVSDASIISINRHVLLRIPGLLDLGGRAHVELTSSWSPTGKELGTGKGATDLFIQGCLELMSWVLAEVGKSYAEAKNVSVD